MAKKAQKKTNFVEWFLFLLNIGAALGLLFSYLAYYVNPTVVSIFAFAGLAYPFFLLINSLFLLYWLLRFKKKLFLSLICILIGFNHIGRTHQLGKSHKVVEKNSRLKVMTYNVRMFNAYEWITEDNIPLGIESLLKAENPDILLIQEYHKADFEPSLGYKYDFRKFTNEGENYGLTIFSNYPIIHTGTYPYFKPKAGEELSNNEFIFADVLWNKDTIRIFNIHLASVGLLQNDYNRLKNPNAGSQEEIKQGFITIMKRLHTAFQKRGNQIDAVSMALAESPHPVILCGDFNDTPYSYTYHKIDEQLEDAYIESGEGFGKTYSRGPVPFRIDHIFHSEELNPINYKVIYKKFSDHYPVTAEFELKPG